MRGRSACIAPHSLVKMAELDEFNRLVTPPMIGALVEVDESYLRDMERAKLSIVAMRFHLEAMPCRNNGGALVKWKQEAERIIADGFGEKA